MLWLLITATPVPTPPPSNVPDDSVTPGVWGFVITALIGVAVILLILDMIRRLRRVNYRAEIRERLEAEAAAESEGSGSPAAK